MKLIFQPWLVEKGDVQHASVVHGPHLDQIHALSDVGQLWLCGDHGGNAGRLTGDQLTDGLDVYKRQEQSDEIKEGE